MDYFVLLLCFFDGVGVVFVVIIDVSSGLFYVDIMVFIRIGVVLVLIFEVYCFWDILVVIVEVYFGWWIG